jgi:hypothetical protein
MQFLTTTRMGAKLFTQGRRKKIWLLLSFFWLPTLLLYLPNLPTRAIPKRIEQNWS